MSISVYVGVCGGGGVFRAKTCGVYHYTGKYLKMKI